MKKVTLEECQRVLAFIIERAKEEESAKFLIPHEDLYAEKDGVPILLESDTKSRIRNHMSDFLSKNGVKATYNLTGYQMTIDENIIDIQKEVEPPKEIETKSHKIDYEVSKFKHTYRMPRIGLRVRQVLDKGGYKPVIIGPPGCGKSTLYEQICLKRKKPVIRRSLGGHITAEDLLGQFQAVTNKETGNPETVFVDGVVTYAMKHGIVLILDEIDQAKPQINSCLQQLLEMDGKLAVYTEHGTQFIKAHPDFRLCFTANTDGTGDLTGMFAGATEQNRSLIDRLRPKFYMDYDEEMEKKVLEDYDVPEGIIKAFYSSSSGGIVPKLREACKSKVIEGFLSTRTIVAFAEWYGDWDWHEAMYYCFVNDFPEAHREEVIETVKQHVGDKLTPTDDKTKIEDANEELNNLVSGTLAPPIEF